MKLRRKTLVRTLQCFDSVEVDGVKYIVARVSIDYSNGSAMIDLLTEEQWNRQHRLGMQRTASQARDEEKIG